MPQITAVLKYTNDGNFVTNERHSGNTDDNPEFREMVSNMLQELLVAEPDSEGNLATELKVWQNSIV